MSRASAVIPTKGGWLLQTTSVAVEPVAIIVANPATPSMKHAAAALVTTATNVLTPHSRPVARRRLRAQNVLKRNALRHASWRLARAGHPAALFPGRGSPSGTGRRYACGTAGTAGRRVKLRLSPGRPTRVMRNLRQCATSSL